ncbi:hypothetical protein [Duganella sp. HH105]|uniref:hypothetical protein n=1 Tax=Duganella sp. HH105 TaxID=1781067 RepID=UPI000877E823|nr:hypothetical protein [Duganella sp. HH105]OEZ55373.1 hypothetical protein DUGA6_54450 [Duganella sp. HH105]
MTTATLPSRKTDLSLAEALQEAERGPFIIAGECGPSHVLLTIADYERLISGKLNLVEMLWMPGMEDIDFDPQRSTETVRPADFSRCLFSIPTWYPS